MGNETASTAAPPIVVFVGGPYDQQYARLSPPEGMMGNADYFGYLFHGYRWAAMEAIPFLYYPEQHNRKTALVALLEFYAVTAARLPQ